MPADNTVLMFDFDGVIVDSFSVCFGVAKTVYPTMTEERYRGYFHGNIYDANDKTVASTKLDQKSTQDFFTLYAGRLPARAPYAGMREAIETLSQSHALVIVSSCLTPILETYLHTHGLLDQFHSVLGADVHESKVAKAHMVFDRLHTRPEHCLFVTDTVGDVREALKAGVASIGVSWGFHSSEELRGAGPFAVVDRPAQIVEETNRFYDRRV